MYYLYLRYGSFDNPDRLIVEYQGNYYFRGKNTDWMELEDEEKDSLLSGRSNRYYAIEDSQFEKILDSWKGSRTGYKSFNTRHLYDHEGYADSYGDEDEVQ